MAIDFPSAPTVGQVYTFSGVTYTFSAQGVWVVLAATPTVNVIPQGHISGLTLAKASGTSFSVAAGQATDSTIAVVMVLASSITKTTGAWAVGTGNGGLDTSTVAASTWYHVYLIRRSDTSVVDVLYSASASSPTLPTNYDTSRRIGSFKTDGSSNVIAFTQIDETFYLATQILDVNVSNLSSTRVLYTLSVPTGIKVQPLIRAEAVISINTNGSSILLTSPDETDVASAASATSGWSAAPGYDLWVVSSTQVGYGPVSPILYTNTSAQIGARASGGSQGFQLVTRGWVDYRGRF